MIEYGEEPVSSIYEIVDELAQVNFEESGLLQGKFLLNVNVDVYQQEFTRVFTLRDNDELVGYAVFLVGPHPHFADKVFAMNDVVYIKPDYRKGSRSFFEYIELSLDVDVINYSMNYMAPHLEFMGSMGYEPTEIMYHKVIRNG